MAKQEEVQYIDLNNQTKIAYIDCGDNKKKTLLFVLNYYSRGDK